MHCLPQVYSWRNTADGQTSSWTASTLLSQPSDVMARLLSGEGGVCLAEVGALGPPPRPLPGIRSTVPSWSCLSRQQRRSRSLVVLCLQPVWQSTDWVPEWVFWSIPYITDPAGLYTAAGSGGQEGARRGAADGVAAAPPGCGVPGCIPWHAAGHRLGRQHLPATPGAPPQCFSWQRRRQRCSWLHDFGWGLPATGFTQHGVHLWAPQWRRAAGERSPSRIRTGGAHSAIPEVAWVARCGDRPAASARLGGIKTGLVAIKPECPCAPAWLPVFDLRLWRQQGLWPCMLQAPLQCCRSRCSVVLLCADGPSSGAVPLEAADKQAPPGRGTLAEALSIPRKLRRARGTSLASSAATDPDDTSSRRGTTDAPSGSLGARLSMGGGGWQGMRGGQSRGSSDALELLSSSALSTHDYAAVSSSYQAAPLQRRWASPPQDSREPNRGSYILLPARHAFSTPISAAAELRDFVLLKSERGAIVRELGDPGSLGREVQPGRVLLLTPSATPGGLRKLP